MSQVLQHTESALDIDSIRSQFPILKRQVNGVPLIYLDNAATSQKPQSVIDAITNYYSELNANIHRGVHTLSQQATDAYEQSRQTIAAFINAEQHHEIIFTRGTTESINLVSNCFGKRFIQPGDEVIITEMEHHSNMVPWQMMCEEHQAVLKIIPVDANGDLIFDEFTSLVNKKTKLLAISHVSNTLGTINPVKKYIEHAHQFGTAVLIDGAQAISHMAVDVQDLDCDFYCFSGHKMYGPTGVGILYGKDKWLTEFPPYHGGGGMIKEVTLQKTIYADLPLKFEAGTPNIEGGIAIGKAIEWIQKIGIQNIEHHEQELIQYSMNALSAIPGIKFIGKSRHHASAVSFILHNIHPYDTGVILDKLGIAVRTGHHCNQPLMKCYNIPGTVRASFAVYNIIEEIDVLVKGLYKVIKMFS
ncbi:MAG: cysteine desulfurase [Chitinophagales bacterium]|nr:cysteine desulfurase [Chitinophagales bacterium]